MEIVDIFLIAFLIYSHLVSTPLGRKRPLICTARNTAMNPTKRTVMTFLARAKNANTLHGFHATGPTIAE